MRKQPNKSFINPQCNYESGSWPEFPLMEKLTFSLFVFGFCLVHSCDNFRHDNLVFLNDSAKNLEGVSPPRKSAKQVANTFNEFAGFTFRWETSLAENSKCRIQTNEVHQEASRLNLWALKMLDASAKFPSGILNGNLNQFGDFDECLNSKGFSRNRVIQGKYCLATVGIKFDKNQESGKIKEIDAAIHSNWILHNEFRDQGHRIPKFETFNVGVCIPASCDAQELEVGLSEQLNKLSRNKTVSFEVSVSDEVCYVEQEKEFSPVKSLVWFILVLLVALILIGTLIDTNKLKINNLKLGKILNCFSLKRNLALLLKTSPPPDDIKCIHGARFLNAVALLLSHKQIAMLFSPTLNRTQMSEVYHRWYTWHMLNNLTCLAANYRKFFNFNIINTIHKYFGTFKITSFSKSWTMIGRVAILYTDSFILFSGLLISYSIVKDLDSKKVMNFKDKLINRIVRLMPNLFGVILFCTYIMNDMGSGPQWGLVVGKYASLCKKYMWRNFLFIHNYFGFENMCLTHTHQLGTDMQLFLLSPIFIYMIWKRPKIGTLLAMVVAAVSTWLRYDKTLKGNLSTLLYYGISVERLWKTASNSYIIPTHRLTVYLTGVMLGYYLRRGGQNLKLTFVQATLGWALGLSSGLLAVFGPYQAAFKEYVYDVNDAARFNAFAPILWTLFLSWSLLACVNGYGGSFNDFLGWKYFAIFTRISYALYLTQFPVFFYNVGMERVAQYYKGFHSLFNIEELAVIFITSIILTLMFDIPFQELKKVLTSESTSIKKDKIKKKTEEANEQVKIQNNQSGRKRLQYFGT